eukprot:RCo042258
MRRLPHPHPHPNLFLPRTPSSSLLGPFRLPALVFLLLTAHVLLTSSAAPPVSRQQAVLTEFYHHNGGPGWANHSHWLEGEVCVRGSPGASRWHGVFCDDAGNVRAIELIENNVGGPLPPELFSELTWLDMLNLAQNGVTGTIPESICEARRLRNLFLQLNTGLTGTIPECMTDLPNLERLVIELTEVGGTLPKRPFREARVLILSMSKFIGTIPDYFEQMPMLTTLIMNGQPEDEELRFSGTIPHTIFGLTRLEFISMQFNNLEGTLEDFSNMQNIRALHLNHNKFNGTIPDSMYEMLAAPLILEELREGKPIKVAYPKTDEHIHLEHNEFNGSISGKILNLPALTELGLADNFFTGYVPSEFEKPQMWRWYPENETALRGNLFLPPVPEWVHDMGAVEEGQPLHILSVSPPMVPRPLMPSITVTGEDFVSLPELVCAFVLPGGSTVLGGALCGDTPDNPLCVTTSARLSRDMTFFTCAAMALPAQVYGPVSLVIAHLKDEFKTGGTKTHIVSNAVPLVVYEPHPRIVSISPKVGRVQGCTRVVVSGEYFVNTGAVACYFNNTKVLATFVNETTLYCVSPSIEEAGGRPGIPMRFNMTPNGGETFSLFNDAVTFTYMPFCPLGTPADAELTVSKACECGLCACSGFGRCVMANPNPHAPFH